MALHHSQLIDHSLHQHTERQVDQSNQLQYFIHDAESSLNLDGHQVQTMVHQPSSEQFIATSFANLGNTIELDFVQVNEASAADIRIYSVNNHQGWADTAVGQVVPDNAGWSVLWKNTSSLSTLSDFDANTIIHELGHALGLSHPDGDGANSLWSTDHTVMSYNISPDGWDYTFSEADQAALLHLWGAESQPRNTTDEPHAPNRQNDLESSHNADLIQSDWTDGRFSLLLKGRSPRNERIIGTVDNDVLVFGEGRDRLRGSKGADLFLIPDNQRFTNKTADRILDFNSEAGDVISLVTNVPDTLRDVNFATAETDQEAMALQQEKATIIYDKTNNQLVHDWNAEAPGLGGGSSFAEKSELNLKIVETKRDSKRLAETEASMIYFRNKGKLFYNANGEEAGLGDSGGLVARLKGQPNLTMDSLQLWAEISG